MQKVKGAALISVLFITAIVAIIATAFAVHVRHLINIATWSRQSNQIYLALQGIQYWGIAELLNAKPVGADQGVVLLPANSKVGPIQYYNVTVQGQIVDQESLFNINQLVDKKQLNNFVRFVRVLDPRYSAQQVYLFGDAIRTKILSQPSLGAQPRFFDISELLTVPGFPTRLYRVLQPYLTALPVSTNETININTAPAPVLMSLSPTLTLSQARSIVNCVKGSGPFMNVGQFNSRCLTPLRISALPNIGISSQYYLIIGEGKFELQQHRLRSLVRLLIIKGRPTAVAVWQAMS